MEVNLIEHYGTDLSVVNAARVSFNAESRYIGAGDAFVSNLYSRAKSDKNNVDEAYIKYTDDIPNEYVNEGHYLKRSDFGLIYYLAQNKHTSCFEHQGATLRLKVPIFIARQIQRHRTFSYNEVSRRYVSTEPEFFWPEKWRKAADNVKQGSDDEEVPANTPQLLRGPALHDFMGRVYDLYSGLLGSGVAPELARMILPQNMYTEFYMTGNLRNWSHFLKLRLDGHAQKEVQDVAKMVQDILTPLWPVSMEALNAYD